MNDVRRLKGVGAALALAAVVTSAHVWGEPADKTQGRFQANTGLLTPDKSGNLLGEDWTQCKFAERPLVTYRTQAGDTLFALQVQPKVEAGPARPRDILVMIDTSASQVGGPLVGARELAATIVTNAGAKDRVALMTVSTPKATKDLTQGFQPPAAERVRKALEDLKQEVPLGDCDLKHAFKQAAELFGGASDRQHVIVFLGDGMSIHNPLSAADRVTLAEDLVRREIAVFPIPVGPRLDPTNLHGLATFTGGSLVRVMTRDKLFDTYQRLQTALAVPVVYPTKFELAGNVVETFPTQLPPLRSETPTLVVGTLKQAGPLSYKLEGTVAGKNVRVEKTEAAIEPELTNYFLVSMVDQWRNGKEHPAMMRADRALSHAHDQSVFARADLIAKAEWALAEVQVDAAKNLFEQVLKLDPQDADAAAGLKVVKKLQDGVIKPDQLGKQLNGNRDVVRIEKGANGKARVTREQILALAQQPEKPVKAPIAPAAEQDDLIQIQIQRRAVAEGQIKQEVEAEAQRAARMLSTDPEGSREILKRAINNVRDNPVIGEGLKRDLLTRLETSLRNAEVVGARILRENDERLERLAQAAQRNLDIQARETAEELTQRRMIRFGHLFNTARYEDASRLAHNIRMDHVNRGLPVPVAVTAGYDVALATQHLRELEELRRLRENRFLAVLMQVERSHIPFPDEPPIAFPNVAFWREITAARKEKYENSGFTEDDPAVLRKLKDIKEKLNKPVSLPKGIDPNTPLKDALEFLSEYNDVTILIDTSAFKAGGLQGEPEQLPVGLPKMTGVSFSTVLRLLLSKLDPPGTFLVRRDYIEITTAERAVLEKTVRAYPVADLVTPIPNAVNQQAVQNQATIFGFAGAAGIGGIGGIAGIGGIGGLGFAGGIGGLGFAGGIGGLGFPGGIGGIGGLGFPGGIGGFGLAGIGGGALGIAGGGVGGLNAGFGGAAGFAGAGGQQVNLGVGGGFAGFGGGQLGQFGNLGGQFGLQGGDQSQILIMLIRQVVGTTQDWVPLRGVNRQAAVGGGIGAPEPDAEQGGDPNTANDLGYYPPARALIVKAPSRFHTRVGGPLVAPRPGLPGGMGQLKLVDPEKAIVINPGDRQRGIANKLNVAANANTTPAPRATAEKNPPARVVKGTPPDAKKVWQDALARGVDDPGLIIACADFLAEIRQFDHLAEFLKANLRQGIVVQPWVYEALALALEASNADVVMLERAQVSAVDLEPRDAMGMVKAAQAMAESKRFDRALAYCRQASLLEPNLADIYDEALRFAESDKNPKAMEWAAGNLLRQVWPSDTDNLHARAKEKVSALRQTLEQANRKLDADRLASAVEKFKERDLVLHLYYNGDADLDLLVKEPIGTVCSALQRQTANGGVLIGDSLLDQARDVRNEKPKESYIAATAFAGDYEVTVRRVWGRPLGSKAVLEVIRNQGTPEEKVERIPVVFDREHKVTVRLQEGRRTALEQVPPAGLQQRSTALAKRGDPDRVLNKLRALADPDIVGVETAFRGGVAGLGTPTERREQPTERRGSQVYQSRLTGSSDVMTKAVVSHDRQRVEYLLHPVFQAMGKTPANRPVVSSPVIPGGADPFGK